MTHFKVVLKKKTSYDILMPGVIDMKIIEPSFEFLDEINGEEMLKKIEQAGRVCYKSEDKVSETSAEKFVGAIIKSGHESVIEHEKITVKIICDRGVTHEIVRHRIASYSQESTRYCNYANDKFGSEITVIKPCFWQENDPKYILWENSMKEIEHTYLKLIEAGATAQESRSVLPNSLKTEIVVTMNLREWRHFFKLRTHVSSHPQMREIATIMLKGFKKVLPVVFRDIMPEVQ